MKNTAQTQLSVNLNKVALVRNTRHVGYPNVTRAAELCLKAGAAGITVHPRPDERHIRKNDVFEIAELMRLWPGRELNIEGNPFHNLMSFVRDLSQQGMHPHQATFVPDSEGQSTSDHGWSFPQDAQRLKPLIDECHALGVRVSLFMDPVAEQMISCKAIGADRVELYTETWARAFGTASEAKVLAQFKATAEAARDAGLLINAGHDLTQANLKQFIAAIPFTAEVSIGHAFVADALEVGYAEAVKAYLALLSRV
jgi:pyridoxine 5-phosphate synthase